MFLKKKIKKSMNESLEQVDKLLKEADAIVIGAGAGLSTSAGFTYSGERFKKYFYDFIEKYGFEDMYSGGFYPFETVEEHWAYWSRYIYINRYMNASIPVYQKLYELVKNKDYFVLTTNVDHCFQKNGFDKQRLFYTQGDYGLFQCSEPCRKETYDNEQIIRKMVTAQGFTIESDGTLTNASSLKMKVPKELVPYCPHCGRPMSMNLRSDSTFVEDAGWKNASNRYSQFLQENHKKNIVFLEAGVGYNTPGIIKYPFWRMTNTMQNAHYICLNQNEIYIPEQIKNRSIGIEKDIYSVLENL